MAGSPGPYLQPPTRYGGAKVGPDKVTSPKSAETPGERFRADSNGKVRSRALGAFLGRSHKKRVLISVLKSGPIRILTSAADSTYTVILLVKKKIFLRKCL